MYSLYVVWKSMYLKFPLSVCLWLSIFVCVCVAWIHCCPASSLCSWAAAKSPGCTGTLLSAWLHHDPVPLAQHGHGRSRHLLDHFGREWEAISCCCVGYSLVRDPGQYTGKQKKKIFSSVCGFISVIQTAVYRQQKPFIVCAIQGLQERQVWVSQNIMWRGLKTINKQFSGYRQANHTSHGSGSSL